MNEVLDDLKGGKFVRTQISGGTSGALKLDSINEMNLGKLIETDDFIRFTDVPIVSPTGDTLSRLCPLRSKEESILSSLVPMAVEKVLFLEF